MALGGIASIGITASQIAIVPFPLPEFLEVYSKKFGESNGIVAMMELLVDGLDTEMTEIEVTEMDAQGDGVQMVADSAEKRDEDSKILAVEADNDATSAVDLRRLHSLCSEILVDLEIGVVDETEVDEVSHVNFQILLTNLQFFPPHRNIVMFQDEGFSGGEFSDDVDYDDMSEEDLLDDLQCAESSGNGESIHSKTFNDSDDYFHIQTKIG